jgi:hypothetical protein
MSARGWLLATCLLAAGCDGIFGLAQIPPDAPPPPPDAAPPPTTFIHPGDADGDGVVNAVDPCPLDQNIATLGNLTDGDHDGIPDTCDPNPMRPDCLLLFDQFQDDAELSPLWKSDVPITLDAAGKSGLILEQKDALLVLSRPLELDTLLVDGYLGGTTQLDAPAEVITYFDVGSPASLTGLGCGPRTAPSATSGTVDLVTAVAGVETSTMSMPTTLTVSAGTDLEIDRKPSGCEVRLYTGGSTVPVDKVDLPNPPPSVTPGTVGVHATAKVSLRFIVGYGGRCP